VRRHPFFTFLVTFNTFGQALAFVPVVARSISTALTPLPPVKIPLRIATTPVQPRLADGGSIRTAGDSRLEMLIDLGAR
jgi:hypothetical protein